MLFKVTMFYPSCYPIITQLNLKRNKTFIRARILKIVDWHIEVTVIDNSSFAIAMRRSLFMVLLRRLMSIRFIAIVLALSRVPAAAETVATPATLSEILTRAGAGETIRLTPGHYDRVSVRDRHWKQAITVSAAAATLSSIRFDNVSGLTWRGGEFEGDNTVSDAMKFEHSDHIVVDGVAFNHYTNFGIGIGFSTDVTLTNNVVTGSGSDGIDVAMSQRVVIDHNRCMDFHPAPGAHPDCVQLWSKPNFSPVSDVTITNNVAIGDMQGFTAFDGPYDRITIEHNFAHVTNYHGIALFDCRHCAVRHNRVESMRNPYAREVRAWIKVVGGTDVINCDNLAVDYPDFPGRGRCKRPE